MKKLFTLTLLVLMLTGLSACKGKDEPSEVETTPTSTTAPTSSSSNSETLYGSGDGFGGIITATVIREDGKITSVELTGEKETNGIGTLALDALPAMIVDANGTNVDAITTATITSDGIIYAVNNALDPATYPYPIESAGNSLDVPDSITASSVYQGFGLDNSGRVGPGKDNEDVQVYSVNQIASNVLFDADGRILAIYIDQLEYATPNYDGEGMPHFSGFPGQGGYNIDENHDEVVDGKTEDTDENFLAEISGFITKRDRGDSYRMASGSWASQMDAFQKLFVGMTVDEVEQWFIKYCSDLNGRPLKITDSSKDEDKAKYEALTEEEKTMLADVVTGATISLNDSHGNILASIKNAYDNRVPVDITSVKGIGVGMSSSGRIGPGKDNEEVQVYSINQIFANTVFDADNRIAAIYVDQLEYATPNYDGETMPHFTGFPGQNAYNADENHDGTVDTQIAPTEETFKNDIAGWATKRDRGDGYRMGTGTWTSQMDYFQKIFVGMTVDEAEQWFLKYCSDLNGRPLKITDTSKDEDKAKYDTLTDEEKEMLVDVVASATMSLNDSHGDILAAIRNSLTNMSAIDITIK